MSAGLTAFQLAFQLSPIVLVNGVSSFMPGSMLPIIALTEAINFPDGLLSGSANIGLSNFFANFKPLPGSSLIDQEIAKYPFANQAVAANAVIQQPLSISMLMDTSVRDTLGYAAKLAIMEVLINVLTLHNQSGGTYHVATSAHLYLNCLMRSIRDASNGQSAQAQNGWILEFEEPLLTLSAAQAAMNSLTNLIGSGMPVAGQPTAWGLVQSVANPATALGSTVVPAAQTSAAAGGISVTPLAPL